MFRFTIRDVLWLTVVAALVVGWYWHASRLSMDVAFWKSQQADSHNELQRLREQSPDIDEPGREEEKLD
jgi:hypothetical protein